MVQDFPSADRDRLDNSPWVAKKSSDVRPNTFSEKVKVNVSASSDLRAPSPLEETSTDGGVKSYAYLTAFER